MGPSGSQGGQYVAPEASQHAVTTAAQSRRIGSRHRIDLGVEGAAAFGVYSAGKASIRQFSRVWAIELAPRGIRVNTIAPTDLPDSPPWPPTPIGRAPLLDDQAQRVPLGRLGQPTEIADAVVFLASPQARFITGIELFIDGGETQV